MPLRVLWPFPLSAPGIIALRVGHGALATEFFTSELALWFTGASLLFAGLLIIDLHQCWSSVAAVIISLFGRTLGIRGAMLMAAPARYERAATSVKGAAVRLVFSVIVAAGRYLTYVSWITKLGLPPAVNEPKERP